MTNNNDKETVLVKCPTCNGRGTIPIPIPFNYVNRDMPSDYQDCPTCNGKGQLHAELV